jgi:hypothetical protein
MVAVNDQVVLDPTATGLNDAKHPALQNGGFAKVHRISPDGKTLWVQPTLTAAIFMIPAVAASASSAAAPLALPKFPTNRKTTIDERD